MDLSKFISGKILFESICSSFSTKMDHLFMYIIGGLCQSTLTLYLINILFFEICFVVDGEGYYIEDDRTYALQKNMMFLSRPDVSHQIKKVKNGLALLYVAFELTESESSEEWIEIIREARKCSKVIAPVSDDTIAVLLWKSLLIQTTNSEQLFYEEMLTNLAYSLILSLLQIFLFLIHTVSIKNKPVEMISPLLSQAKLYINDNITSPLKT
ncbi:hypothetical protein GCM10020331_016860 [Ectobacillus funiculus]